MPIRMLNSDSVSELMLQWIHMRDGTLMILRSIMELSRPTRMILRMEMETGKLIRYSVNGTTTVKMKITEKPIQETMPGISVIPELALTVPP